jgi:TonB family protein
MTSRIQSTAAIVFVLMFTVALAHTRANGTTQSASGPAPQGPAHKILTKDPEYLKLLSPPLGNDFLQMYSDGYRQKSAEIEASIAGVSDDHLRDQARRNEWARLLERDRDKFRTEADVNFNQAKIQFAREHRDAWFDVGHVSYDATNNSLVVEATPTAPIDAGFRVVLNGESIDQIYDQFRQIAAGDIDQKTREYVSKAEADSNCSRNPDWCYKFAKDEMEARLRSERMVVVAQGDLEERRIDRLLLIDYDTQSVLLELDPHISALNTAAWRFSVGLVTAVSAKQPEAPETSETPAPPKPAPPRLQVPAQVTAAAILTRTNPVYPLRARAAQIQGDVLLHAIIDKEGKISDLQVLSGDDLLARSALEAVRQWRYKPMLYDGEPTEVDTTITVTFSLLN